MTFLEHITTIIGKEEAIKLIESINEEPIKCLRVNTLYMNPLILKELYPNIVKNNNIDYSYYYNKNEYDLGKSVEHFAGGIYIQDASAMLVTHLLDPKPHEKVIDLCAAPGGKATQASILMNNTGLVVANDYNDKRSDILSENVERLGITNTIVLNNTIETIANHFGGYFDKVILDAPCSGEGMFRKNDDAYLDWSIDKVHRLSSLQKELIMQAYSLLRKDGIMVYSTCTFEKEENEDVVNYLLENTNAELIMIKDIEGASRGINMIEAIRLYPSYFKGEGQFIALIKCNDDHEIKLKKYQSKNKQISQSLKLINDFILEYSNNSKIKDIYPFNTTINYLEYGNINIDKLRVKRYGLNLGQIINNRFEPSHSLMKVLDLKNNHNITIEEYYKFIKGETLENNNYRGYIGIKYNNLTIGFGKASNNQIKNHLPKGLRIN